MVEDLCGATYIAKEHDGVHDGTLRLMRLHPVHVPAVNFLPLIFRGHAEALVPLLPAELACSEFGQGQTPLVVLVRAAVVAGVHRLKMIVELRAAEFEAERPTFVLKQFPQFGTLLLIAL